MFVYMCCVGVISNEYVLKVPFILLSIFNGNSVLVYFIGLLNPLGVSIFIKLRKPSFKMYLTELWSTNIFTKNIVLFWKSHRKFFKLFSVILHILQTHGLSITLIFRSIFIKCCEQWVYLWTILFIINECFIIQMEKFCLSTLLDGR